MGNDFHFVLLAKDNLAQARTCLGLLLRVQVFKDAQEYVPNLFVRLAVHYVIPVCVFDFLLADLSVGLRHTFLQFQKVLIELLPHRVIANRTDDAFQQSEGLRALMEGLDVLHVEGIDCTQLQFDLNHSHMEVNGLNFASLVVQL